jgi:hypothetical protein
MGLGVVVGSGVNFHRGLRDFAGQAGIFLKEREPTLKKASGFLAVINSIKTKIDKNNNKNFFMFAPLVY